MEFQFPSFPIMLCFILCLFVAMKMRKRSKSSSKLPPGPWKLPLIGNLHQMIGSQPHHALASLAKIHGPLMSLQVGEIPFLVVSSAEYAKEIMKTHNLVFASRPQLNSAKFISYNFTNVVFAPYGEYWRQLRKICHSELLSVKRVRSFHPIIQEEVSKLINWVYSKTSSPINLTEKILSSSFDSTSRMAFRGIANTDEFISVIKESVRLLGGFNVGDLFPSIKFLHLISGVSSDLEKVNAKGSKILGEIIDEHIKAKTESRTQMKDVDDDFVDVLLKFHDPKAEFTLSIDNIKAIIQDVIGAGGEASSVVVDWAMAEMIKNPRVMEKAQAEVRRLFDKKVTGEIEISELKYLKLVIKETLRLHTPGPLLVPRENNERCEINGYEISKKTRVVINAWAIARDTKYWGDDAEIFYPERFIDNPIDFKGANFEFIPFGAGIRICPGIGLAIANVEILLSELLYHFDWKLADGSNPQHLDMTDAFGLATRRKKDLYLIPSPHK